jgi:hypothetical protein
MRLAPRSTVIASALAIAAIAAPAASARFDLGPQQGPNNVIPSTAYAVPVTPPLAETTGPRPEVRPNPDQQVLGHGVPIPPMLGKTKAEEQAAIARLKAQHWTSKLPVNAAYTAKAHNGSGHPVSVQAPKSPSSNPDNGFDWGDAAIGAAAGLALTLLIGGSTLMLSRRRSPQGDSANVATT